MDAGAAVLSVRMSVARLWRMVWAQDAAEDAGCGPHLPSLGTSKQELRFRWTGPKKQDQKAKMALQSRRSLLAGMRQAHAGVRCKLCSGHSLLFLASADLEASACDRANTLLGMKPCNVLRHPLLSSWEASRDPRPCQSHLGSQRSSDS